MVLRPPKLKRNPTNFQKSKSNDMAHDFIKTDEQMAKELVGIERVECAWISVARAIPDNGQRVLVAQNPVTTATREPLFAQFVNGRFTPPEPTYFADFERGVTMWVDITHWMPLPPMPKK